MIRHCNMGNPFIYSLLGQMWSQSMKITTNHSHLPGQMGQMILNTCNLTKNRPTQLCKRQTLVILFEQLRNIGNILRMLKSYQTRRSRNPIKTRIIHPHTRHGNMSLTPKQYSEHCQTIIDSIKAGFNMPSGPI